MSFIIYLCGKKKKIRVDYMFIFSVLLMKNINNIYFKYLVVLNVYIDFVFCVGKNLRGVMDCFRDLVLRTYFIKYLCRGESSLSGWVWLAF